MVQRWPRESHPTDSTNDTRRSLSPNPEDSKKTKGRGHIHGTKGNTLLPLPPPRKSLQRTVLGGRKPWSNSTCAWAPSSTPGPATRADHTPCSGPSTSAPCSRPGGWRRTAPHPSCPGPKGACVPRWGCRAACNTSTTRTPCCDSGVSDSKESTRMRGETVAHGTVWRAEDRSNAAYQDQNKRTHNVSVPRRQGGATKQAQPATV